MLLHRYVLHFFLFLAVFISALPTAHATEAGNSDAVDFKRIKLFAMLSQAAYETDKAVAELLSKNNQKLLLYRTIPELEVAYFIAQDNQTGDQLIAVRGTSNVENALVDVALKLRQDQNAGIKLHDGFSLAASHIITDIRHLLKKDSTIHTTGHSLGGAVALILAMYMDYEGFNVGEVVTFGQPKVTNISGSKAYQHLNHTRVVTPRDLVPLVPPFDPLDIHNLDIYWHGGREVVLNSDQSFSILLGTDSMLRATKFTQQMLDMENLTNHQMTLYIKLVNLKATGARQVPFKNSFNLFNLFGSE